MDVYTSMEESLPARYYDTLPKGEDQELERKSKDKTPQAKVIVPRPPKRRKYLVF